MVWHGAAGMAWRGKIRYGKARCGKVRHGRQVPAWFGLAGQGKVHFGMAGKVWISLNFIN